MPAFAGITPWGLEWANGVDGNKAWAAVVASGGIDRDGVRGRVAAPSAGDMGSLGRRSLCLGNSSCWWPDCACRGSDNSLRARLLGGGPDRSGQRRGGPRLHSYRRDRGAVAGAVGRAARVAGGLLG